MKSPVLLLCCVLAHALSEAAELVKTCDVGSNAGSRVDAVRDSKIGDTYVYYLRQNDATRPFFEDKDSSRGASVHIACVGSHTRALVVSGEFTANFLQGFVLSRSPVNGLVERLDFAEKNRPSWLYLSPSETAVVIRTNGYGETNKKFIVYRHFTGADTEPQVVPMDELPARAGAEVIELDGRP